MHIIIDLILVAIILYSAWKGYRKGLILGISGLVALFVAFFGARIVADNYSQEFVSMLEPFVSGIVDASMEKGEYSEIEGVVMPSAPADGEGEDGAQSPSDTAEAEATAAPAISQEDGYEVTYGTLKNLGVLRGTAESLAREISDRVKEAGTSIRTAIISGLSEKITYTITLVIVFVMILIIFTVIANIVNLAFKLPGLDVLNNVGGIVFGLVKGLIYAFLVAWVLSYLGILIGKNFVDDTILLKFMMDHNLLMSILKG